MHQYVQTLIERLQQHALLTGIAVVSIGLFVVSTVSIMVFFVRIPPDFFLQHPSNVSIPTPTQQLIWLGKNLFGWVLIAIGTLLLVLPGQGLITILMGLSLVDFKAKSQWVQRVVSHRYVLPKINQWRHFFGKPPLCSTPIQK